MPASIEPGALHSAQDELKNNHSTCAWLHFTLKLLLNLDASRLQEVPCLGLLCVVQSRGEKVSKVGTYEMGRLAYHMGSWSPALGAASWLPCLPACHFSSSISKLTASLSCFRMMTLHEKHSHQMRDKATSLHAALFTNTHLPAAATSSSAWHSASRALCAGLLGQLLASCRGLSLKPAAQGSP